MKHYAHFPFRRSAATFLALLLATPSFQLQAGDLNSEVNNMFNNLGAIGIYSDYRSVQIAAFYSGKK